MIALSVFAELESPYAKCRLKKDGHVRSRWGVKNLDKAWKEKTGQEVPEEMKGEVKREKGKK